MSLAGTIFAPATPPGRGAIAIVRISGAGTDGALRHLVGGPLPSSRKAALREIRDPASGEIIDRGLVVRFVGPRSYTGEDMAELHLHGGRAVLSGVLATLGSIPGLRPAEPGEFSRRAFHAGKLDLTEVEAVADLVDAETAAQRRQAMAQLAGALGRVYEGWRARLMRLLAEIEAALDFPDEDLPDLPDVALRSEALAVADEIARHLDDGGRGERLRIGASVAIAGAPNVGKSSLLNALAGRDAAIVSARAGTTRDVIEVHLDLGGLPVTLADTAGLRATDDPIEAEGVRRAEAAIARADLVIHMIDPTATDPGPDAPAGAILVLGKVDLLPPAVPVPTDRIAVSALTGAGLDRLEAALRDRIEALLVGDGSPVVTRQRHRSALQEALAHLERCRAASSQDLFAEDLRLAVRAIGRITGRVDVEDLLDLIFREFCIGK